jgi:polar amino acid transport system substrate-binding protein
MAAALAPTGTLRASINLGNPVLAQGTPGYPVGVTIELSREIGARLGVSVSFRFFQAAKQSFSALVGREADIAFLAIEPARAVEVWFTEPYAIIEGVYAVPRDSVIRAPGDVDRASVRIGVKEGSAYDLFLSRTLANARLVRARDGIDAFRDHALDAAAGIRQPLTAIVGEDDSLRLVEPAFMEIRQAVAATGDAPAAVRQFLHETVEDLKATGFVADALARSSQDPALAAAPARR